MGADWIAAGTTTGSGGADWVARGIALAAALIALGTLAWNVITWYRQGAVIVARALLGVDTILLTVNNRGRLATTIEALVLGYPSGRVVFGDELPGIRGESHEFPVPVEALGQVDIRLPFGPAEDDALRAGELLYVNVFTGEGKSIIAVVETRR